MVLQHLPIETLEQIFSQGVLTHADLLSLSRVCKYFNEILGQDYVWRIQNFKTWPMCKHMDTEMTAKEFSQHRLQFAWKIRNLLKAMGPAYYSQEYVSELDMAEVDQFIDNVNLGQEMVVEELEQIYKYSENLTTQHYCQMLLLWRRRFAEMDWWVERSESGSDDDNLEEIAWRVCRWAKCCPPLSFVTEKLDMMAGCIAEKLPFKQRENLSTSQTYSVFTAVRDHMFKVEGFHLKRGSDGEENRQGLMITDVLTSQGSSPYVLCIIFKALAKRLGVTCQILNKERKDLVGVRWEEFPFRDVSQRWTYLDIGDITEDTIVKLPAAEPHDALVSSSQVTHILLTELAGAMVGTADHANLIHVLNLLSKLTLIPQEGHQYLNSLKSRHQGHEHNTVDGQDDCYSTNRAKFELANNQKRRKEDSEVEYSSGMIMRHKRYNYLCVIRGWDETCEASLDWIWQMGVHNLNKKQFQPFYHVLVNDNTQRYAAQESLEIAVESPEVDHHQLGKYFTHFAGTHYKLNEESQWVYPEDQELTAIIMEKFVARVLREKNKTLSYFS